MFMGDLVWDETTQTVTITVDGKTQSWTLDQCRNGNGCTIENDHIIVDHADFMSAFAIPDICGNDAMFCAFTYQTGMTRISQFQADHPETVAAAGILALGLGLYDTWKSSGLSMADQTGSIKVPGKLMKSDGVVDLSAFDSRMKGMPGDGKGFWSFVNPKTGWFIQKDVGDFHGGSAFKLFDALGNRMATLDATGKILRR